MTGTVGRLGRVPREAVSILVAVGQVAVQRGSTYAEGLAAAVYLVGFFRRAGWGRPDEREHGLRLRKF